MSRPLIRRIMRWSGMGLLALLLVLGVGRFVQVWVQSSYSGEREPYLQMVSDHAITIRWRTKTSERGVVRYGDRPDHLDMRAEEAGADAAHEVRIKGLKPATRYYYAVGDAMGVWRGADANHYFITSPMPGTVQPTTIWVTGDQGEPGTGVESVWKSAEAAAEAERPGRPPFDLWLTLGDNAYGAGTNIQFQNALFTPFASLLAHTPIWLTYGNHDARRWAYYHIFTLPTHGEAGGVPSGSEHYYSFDYANIHIVVLDTESGSLEPEGAMLNWLRKDLAANKLTWTIVTSHHPPYTHGGHDSDRERDSWGRMVRVREHVLPILEKYGVDLMLSGHSHDYERTRMLDCYYGSAKDYSSRYVVEPGRGMNPPYRKPLARTAHDGIVYVVAGSSSKLDHGPLDHPAMVKSTATLGSLLVDVNGDTLRVRFITNKGKVGDEFRIIKGPGAPPPHSCPPN